MAGEVSFSLSERDHFDKSHIIWSEEGLQNRNEHGSFASAWSGFYGWRCSKGRFTIFMNEGFFYLIPAHALSSEQAADLRETLVRSGLCHR